MCPIRNKNIMLCKKSIVSQINLWPHKVFSTQNECNIPKLLVVQSMTHLVNVGGFSFWCPNYSIKNLHPHVSKFGNCLEMANCKLGLECVQNCPKLLTCKLQKFMPLSIKLNHMGVFKGKNNIGIINFVFLT
jgi:hypothetical protein